MSVTTQKMGMTVRDLVQRLLQVEDLDVPFLTHQPKTQAEDGEGDEEETRGVVLDADDTASVFYVTETSNGVVVSEQQPAD